MALDHKYESWFDYMEPHVKPTTPAQPFPPSIPSLLRPILHRPRVASHASANVAALYLPPCHPAASLHPDRDVICTPKIFLFSATYAQKVTNEYIDLDILASRTHLMSTRRIGCSIFRGSKIVMETRECLARSCISKNLI